MQRVQIQQIGEYTGIVLTEEILKKTGLSPGDELNVDFNSQKLIITCPDETSRQQKIDKALDGMIRQRNSAYQRLAG